MHQKKPRILTGLFLRILLTLSTLPLLALISLTTVSVAAADSAAPKTYLALGDSLAFGFQPNNDFTHGYAVDLFQTLQAERHFDMLVDRGCVGETSSTFISTPCSFPSRPASQLALAVAYLKQNAKTTGLITLQIGVNDFILNPAIFNPATCEVKDGPFKAGLATLDNNLTQIILPQLDAARQSNNGHHARLALVDYYNPLQSFCPNTVPFIQTLNNHLQADADGFGTLVDISNSFDPTNVCTLTWICDPTFHDIHPTTAGYQVIANDIHSQLFSDDGD